MKHQPKKNSLSQFVTTRFIDLRSRGNPEDEAIRQIAMEARRYLVGYLVSEGFTASEAEAKAEADVTYQMKRWFGRRYAENPYAGLSPTAFKNNEPARDVYVRRFKVWRKKGYPPRIASYYAWQDIQAISSKPEASRARQEARMLRHPKMYGDNQSGSAVVMDAETNNVLCVVTGKPGKTIKVKDSLYSIEKREGNIFYARKFKENGNKGRKGKNKGKLNPTEVSGQPFFWERKPGQTPPFVPMPPSAMPPSTSSNITMQELAEALKLLRELKAAQQPPQPQMKVFALYHEDTETPLGYASAPLDVKPGQVVTSTVEPFVVKKVDSDYLLVKPVHAYRYAVIAYHRNKEAIALKQQQGIPISLEDYVPSKIFHIAPVHNRSHALVVKAQLKRLLVQRGYGWRADENGPIIKVIIVPWKKVQKYHGPTSQPPSEPGEPDEPVLPGTN